MKFIYVSLLFLLCSPGILFAQSWKWALSSEYKTSIAGGRSYTNPEGITVVAGSYMDSLKIGDTRLVNEGSGKFFIAIINPDGSISHCFSDGESFPNLEPVSYGMIYGTAMDADNNIFISGLATSPITFGAQTFTAPSPSTSQSFVAKYSYEGILLWVKAFSAPANENAELMYDIQLDNGGNVYCTGAFREGNLDLGDTVLISTSESNAYLIKYSSNGDLQWAKTFSTENGLSSGGLELAFHNNTIYWTGVFEGDLIMDNQALVSSENGNLFVASLSQTGALSWIINSVSASPERSIVYKDSLLIIGAFGTITQLLGEIPDHDCLFLIAYDLSGNEKWRKQIVTMDPNNTVFSYGAITALFTDLSQSINVGGMFAGNVMMGENNLSSMANSPDLFLLKINAADGNVSESMTDGTSKTEYPWSIGMDRCGNNYFSGYYTDSTLFGDHKLVNDQTVSFFVSKYENNPECLNITANKPSEASINLSIYPNPAKQDVNIYFPVATEKATVILYDEIGKMEIVQHHIVTEQHLTVPLQLLPGLYVLKVIASNQTYTSKLILE